MTIKEQIQILDNKIRQNRADFNLNRKNAEITALSSGDLNKYEYLTDEDLIDLILYKKLNLNIVLWVKCLIKD